MTSYSFYETGATTYNKAVPGLLFKIYETLNKPLMLLTADTESTKNFDKLLWSFSPNKFLPHGTPKDSPEHYAPLLVSDNLENSNDAEILVSTCPIPDEFATNFKKVIFVYPETSDDKKYYSNIFEQEKSQPGTKFWKQDQQGKWSMIGQNNQ